MPLASKPLANIARPISLLKRALSFVQVVLPLTQILLGAGVMLITPGIHAHLLGKVDSASHSIPAGQLLKLRG